MSITQATRRRRRLYRKWRYMDQWQATGTLWSPGQERGLLSQIRADTGSHPEPPQSWELECTDRLWDVFCAMRDNKQLLEY